MRCGSNALEAAQAVELTEHTPARAKLKRHTHRTGAQPLAPQAAPYPVLLVPVFLKDTRTLAGCNEEHLLQVYPPEVVQGCCSSRSSSSSSSKKRKKHATTAQQGVLPAQGHLQHLTMQV
jgi:hypothetical protein